MNLSKLIEETYTALGFLSRRAVATGGNATTIQDTDLLTKKGTNFYKNYIAFISQTTDGASPQGKFGIVSAYAASNPPTFTIPTVTDAVGAGDIYSVMKPTIELYEMIAQINLAMSMLPAVRLSDVSLTGLQDTKEYTLPAATKGYQIQEIKIGNATDGWVTHKDWYIRPAAAGSTEKLVFLSQPPYDGTTAANETINIIYLGKQTALTTYSDTITEKYPDELVYALCAFRVLEYYIAKKNLFTNKTWMGKRTQFEQRYTMAQQQHIVRTPPAVQPRTLMLGQLP